MFLQTSICLCLFSAVTLFAASLNPAGVLLRLLVVADAHEEDVSRVFCNLRRVILLFNLVDGCIGRMIELKLYDQCRLADIATGITAKVAHPIMFSIRMTFFGLVPLPI